MKISDQPLWSLQPLARPTPPRTRFDALAHNTVDRFLFAALEAKGLQPSPPADRRALIRRVTVDLTGLPPTADEVAAFLADHSPDAYRRLVNRLLASPAYGEHWGRHWLDIVRYGESQGYEQNHLRPNAWPYRDYVIRAFNEDKPYPQFVREQLAGDVLAHGDANIEAATGFLVAGVHDTVGNQTEQGRRQQRANDLDDIVSTTGATFLALTVGCAKCHDHKFDPVPQQDYYRLKACFAGVRHGERLLTPGPSEADSAAKRVAAERRLREVLGERIDLRNAARAVLLRRQGANPPPRPAVDGRRNVERFPPVKARYLRFTILATRDGGEPCLDELEAYGPKGDANLALAATGARATASSLLPGYAIHQIAHLNDGKFGNSWSWISNERGGGWAQIEFPQPVILDRVVWGRDSSPKPRFADRLASQYRVEVSTDGQRWTQVSSSENRAPAPESIPFQRLKAAFSPEQARRWEQLSKEADELSDSVEAGESRRAYIGQFTTPDRTYILARGDVMHREAEVTPAALSRVPGYPADIGWRAGATEPERRLDLANWIVNPKNPLTARVMVNRVWQYHFGQGIVGTPSDFGHNGERPTHPALLDWLAADFMAHGWRLKRLHRMLVTSYAYQQSSAVNPRGQAADAGNRLLWRMPLRRLDAESVRDAILQTSGKLNRKMGGPSFKLFNYQVVNVAIYSRRTEYGPETWRRSVYRQPARGIREELLGEFDCPESSQRTPRRPSTTTALQALSLLNGPFITQQSAFFAERIRQAAGDSPAEQVRRAFRLAFSRSPNEEETRSAVALIAREDLKTLCRALLNANEFLYY